MHVEMPKDNPSVATFRRLGFRSADDLGDRWHLVWNPRVRNLVERNVG